MDQQAARRYSLSALAQAVIGGLIVLGVGASWLIQPASLRDAALVQTMAGLGLLSVAYYGSLHQLLKRKYLFVSSLVLTLITASNWVVVITATGGLESPFYSLWLLVIVASGIFGPASTIITTSATLGYSVLALAGQNFQPNYIAAKLPQLIITLLAAGLAEWVWWQLRRGSRQMEQAKVLSGQLGAEQLKAQALMANMADGVAVVDQKLQIVLFNPAAQAMTGWDEPSAKGMNYHSVMQLKTADDKDMGDSNDPFIMAWHNKKPLVRDDLALVTRAGRKVALNLSISPLFDQNGFPTGGIAVFRDISKNKEVERQRNEFISTASHEMRTPVAAIEGYIALALNPKVATIDDRASSYLDKAHQNTQHLGQLFRDLLSITKVEDGRLGKNIVPADIGKLVQDVVADMQTVASKKGLSLTFTGGDGGAIKSILPLYVAMVDSERLREVTMNLIDNAVKYTSQGGITVNITGTNDTITVSVSDTGPGIAQEDIGHLFQKFYRVDNSATRTVGGTGLGLYLCRTLIELFNGRIWVDSTPGQGSTFHYSLPRVSSEQLTQSQPAGVAAPNAVPVAPATASSVLAPGPIAELIEATPPATAEPAGVTGAQK